MVRRSTFASGKFGSGKNNARAKDNTRAINGILTDYKRFVGVVEDEAFRIMQEAAEMTLQAIIPYVPVETGALRESGRARAVKNAKGVAAVVTFGGEDAPVTPTKNAPDGIVRYASIINYGGGDEGEGGRQFLERGMMESRGDVDSFIVSELKKVKP